MTKTRLFACEMTEILLSSPSVPTPISKIRPLYEDKFGKTFTVSEYGHAKLIKLLETIPDVIDVSASDYVYTSGQYSPSPLPPPLLLFLSLPLLSRSLRFLGLEPVVLSPLEIIPCTRVSSV